MQLFTTVPKRAQRATGNPNAKTSQGDMAAVYFFFLWLDKYMWWQGTSITIIRRLACRYWVSLGEIERGFVKLGVGRLVVGWSVGRSVG